MTIIIFIEILLGKLKYLLILPIIAGTFTFFLTRKLPAQYEAETSIYTGITSNTGLDVTAIRVDKLVTQNEYNNVLTILKSESLMEEISLRLLAQHLMLAKPQKEIISEVAFNDLQKNVPDKVKILVVKGDYERTYQNLKNFVNPDSKNYLYSILNYDHPYYSIKALSTIKVEQINSSDMIQLSYVSEDAGICCNTLKIIAKAFISKYGELKRKQKNSTVRYFQGKLDEVSRKLKNSEDSLLQFNTSNNIINYYEQTKQITTQNEEIELRLQDVKMKNEGSKAVLKKLENEIRKRFAINLRNEEILDVRGQLVSCNTQIAQTEVRNNDNSLNVGLNSLYKKRNSLEKKLENCIDSIYKFESNSEGIESRNLLGSWLDAVKDFEASSAMLRSMQVRQVEFLSQFKRYAPLGSTTKRIEREINVYEGEYLEILNNHNAALRNEQNADMISNMRIIDDAQYPINSIPSKKKLYILISIIFALIFFILGVFFVEMMDHRIKTPSMIASLTGIEFLGAFCSTDNKKIPNTELILHKAVVYILEKIRLLSANGKKPFIIQILSVWDGVGKTATGIILQQELEKRGFRVGLYNFMSAVSATKNDENTQELLNRFYKSNYYSELFKVEDQHSDYIITVIPSVYRGIENPILIKDADLNFVVYNANLIWSKADSFHTDKIKQLVGNNVYTILSNASPENLKEVYGEIDKKRSKLRILMKKALKRIS